MLVVDVVVVAVVILHPILVVVDMRARVANLIVVAAGGPAFVSPSVRTFVRA